MKRCDRTHTKITTTSTDSASKTHRTHHNNVTTVSETTDFETMCPQPPVALTPYHAASSSHTSDNRVGDDTDSEPMFFGTCDGDLECLEPFVLLTGDETEPPPPLAGKEGLEMMAWLNSIHEQADTKLAAQMSDMSLTVAASSSTHETSSLTSPSRFRASMFQNLEPIKEAGYSDDILRLDI